MDVLIGFGRFLLHVFNSIDVPAVVLLAMLLAGGMAMWQAQSRPDFDWGDGFKNDAGQVSFVRMGVLVSIGVSSWVMIYITIITIRAGDITTGQSLDALYKYFITYLLVWSGTKIAERLVEIAAVKFGVTLPASAVAPTPTVTQTTTTTTPGTP